MGVAPRLPAAQKPKRFFMNAGYNDFKKALLRRGWQECRDKYDDTVDLKFTLGHNDINHQRLKPGAIINHNRGEACMTCKTALIETLSEAQGFWASWLTDETGIAKLAIEGFDVAGIDSFFPRQYIISQLDGQAQFFEDMVFQASEAFLKLFVKAFEKDDKYTKSPQFPKEKLVVCSNLI